MHWVDVVCALLIVLGLLLFLYGANYYVDFAGWAGLGLFIGGFVVYFAWKLYELFRRKKGNVQKP